MTSDNGKLPANLGLDAETVLGTYPGPALLFGADGRLLAANSAGSGAAETMTRFGDDALLAGVRDVAGNGGVRACSLMVRGEKEEAIEFSLVPLGASEGATSHVIALGRHAELEQSLMSALVSSRQMFKDLVECSSDFAWETKSDGTFSYVSRRGALGYRAADLIGKRADELIANEGQVEAFSSPGPVEEVEVWAQDASGEPACLLVSSIPVQDEENRWSGNRGVCKDITLEKQRAHDLEVAELREQLLGEVVDAMRNEAEPQHMLGAAARAAGHILGARYCWIVRARRDGTFTGAVQFAGPEGPPPRPIVEAVRLQLRDEDEELFVKTDNSTLHVLVNVARYRDRVNGAICVARDDDAYWDETDRSLLSGVANHLGIAFAQIENGELLKELSRTDELTQLFNRRAFGEEVGLRLRALRRTARKAALLFIDLDNFKRVNDVHGHKRGDEALVYLAQLLTSTSRVGDIVARLGGDEFAMWLEDTDEEGAAAKAESVLAECQSLKQFSGDAEHPLSVSIGVVVTDPRAEEPLDMLVTRADEAMYQAKRGGKGRFAVAPVLAPEQASGQAS